MHKYSHKKLTKFHFLFVASLVFFCTHLSQAAIDPDSVMFYEKNINKYAPKEKVNILISLSRYYSKFNAKKSEEKLYSALKVATSERDTFSIIDIEMQIGVIFFRFDNKQESWLDSAKKHFFNALILLDEKENLDLRFQVYFPLGQMYERVSLSKSQIYYEKAYKIASANAYKDDILLYITSKIAFINLKLEQYQKVILYSLKVIELCEKLGLESDKIGFLSYIGNSYYKMGQYEKALDYFFQELALRRKYDVNPLNDDFLDKLAKVYNALGQYDKALEYYKRAISLYKQNIEKPTRATTLEIAQYDSKIGLVYHLKKDYNTAVEYYSKALKLIGNATDTESLKGKSVIYNNLALTYKALGQVNKALETVQKSERIIDQLGGEGYEFLTLTSFAEIYSQLENFPKAEDYLQRAIEKANKDGNISNLKSAKFLLYQLYSNSKKYQLALETYIDYKNMTDSLLNLDMTGRLAEFQTVYEMEKRNQENNALKLANQLQREKARLERQSFLLITFFTVLVALVLMILFYFRKRATSMLVYSNVTIENQNAVLLELNEDLRKNEYILRHANTTKDKFLSIIAHDLKNPMHSIGFSADLMINYFDTLTDEKKVDHLKGIYKTSNHAYDLLENLLHWARAQSESLNYEPEISDLGALVKSVVDLSYSSAENKKITIVDNVSPNSMAYFDRNMIDTVVRNLVSNSIKFSNENGKIEVYLYRFLEYVCVEVRDNGIGISEEVIDKIFKIEEQISTRGTMKESGTGLGLLLCKEFVNINRGDIWVNSVLGEGTSFIFSLPTTKTAIYVSKETLQQQLQKLIAQQDSSSKS
jgi:signal transduction histidine kinase